MAAAAQGRQRLLRCFLRCAPEAEGALRAVLAKLQLSLRQPVAVHPRLHGCVLAVGGLQHQHG